MTTLKSSHDFDTLPSERCPERESAAARALHKLARKAVFYGPGGFGSPSDRGNRARRQLRAAREAGERVELVWETRPGAFIQDEPKEVRRALGDLTAEDVVTIDPEIDLWQLHNFALRPEPGKCYLFGPCCARFPAGEPKMPLADAPTIWTMK